MGRTLLCLIFLCLTAAPALAFYLPGVAPQDYAKVCSCERNTHRAPNFRVSLCSSILFWCLQGDKVVLKVNKLTSIKTQLPYEYYSMPYCRPEKILPSAENLGEVLRGDRIENSPYEVCQSCSLSCMSRVQCLGIMQERSAMSNAALLENFSWRETDASMLQIFIRVDEQCKTLCKIDALSANQAKAFKGKIEDDYRVLM